MMVGKRILKEREEFGIFFIFFMAALVVIAVVMSACSSSEEEPTAEEETANHDIIMNEEAAEEEQKESFTLDLSSVSLLKDAYPDVNALAETYLEALRQGDIDTLNRIILSETEIRSVTATGDYVEGYENVACYSLDGFGDIAYVVYVVYDEKLIGIETPAPSMIRILVTHNEETGELAIYNGTIDSDWTEALEMADSNEDVIILKAQVNQAFEDACKQDADLAAVSIRLQQSLDYVEESEEAEETTKSAAEETTKEETEEEPEEETEEEETDGEEKAKEEENEKSSGDEGEEQTEKSD